MLSYFRNVAVGVILGLLVGCALGSIRSSHARNLGQFDSDTDRAKWFRSLMQPDNPAVSCCGPADAYYCDDLHTRDGKNYCSITDDRDDAPLGRVHRAIGEEFEIPDNKMMTGSQIFGENPTGHNVLFLSTSGYVWCFVLSGGI